MTSSASSHIRLFQLAVALTLFALCGPAQADIVYHSTKIAIFDGTYNLDLNGDGATDFVIASSTTGVCKSGEQKVEMLRVTPSSGNLVLLGPLKGKSEIGPDQLFGGGGIL